MFASTVRMLSNAGPGRPSRVVPTGPAGGLVCAARTVVAAAFRNVCPGAARSRPGRTHVVPPPVLVPCYTTGVLAAVARARSMGPSC